MLTLNDPSLFREQCYVNGQWIDADDKSVIKVDNPSKVTLPHCVYHS